MSCDWGSIAHHLCCSLCTVVRTCGVHSKLPAFSSPQMQKSMASRWPATSLVFRAGVLRGASPSSRNVGLNSGYHAHLLNTSGDPSLGRDVLLDTLLLSRTDFLLKSCSSVSEFALYWTPHLINRSYDFTLTGSPLPPWSNLRCRAKPNKNVRPRRGLPPAHQVTTITEV